MMRQRQTIFGELGNCMATALACLLGRNVKEIPNFADGGLGAGDGWFDRMWNWVNEQGYELLTFGGRVDRMDPFTLYMVIGESPRNPEWNHAVIYLGQEPFWDPHPDSTFINGKIKDFYTLRRKPKQI